MAAPAPSDSPKPSSPHASATSVASALMSEIALTALPSCRADWNARKPASVAERRQRQPPGRKRPVRAAPADRDGLDRGIGDSVEDPGGERPQRPDPMCADAAPARDGESDGQCRGRHDHQGLTMHAVGPARDPDSEYGESDGDRHHRSHLRAVDPVREEPRRQRHRQRQAAGGERLDQCQRCDRHSDYLGTEADPADRLASEPGAVAHRAPQRGGASEPTLLPEAAMLEQESEVDERRGGQRQEQATEELAGPERRGPHVKFTNTRRRRGRARRLPDATRRRRRSLCRRRP